MTDQQTPAQASPIPITLARGDIIPTKYLILETTHCCRHCNSKTLTYQTFAVCHIRTSQAHGRKFVEHMIPIDSFSYNVRQEWRKGHVEFTACCDDCTPWSCLEPSNNGHKQLDLSHLPTPVADAPDVVLAIHQQPATFVPGPTDKPGAPTVARPYPGPNWERRKGVTGSIIRKPKTDPLDLI